MEFDKAKLEELRTQADGTTCTQQLLLGIHPIVRSSVQRRIPNKEHKTENSYISTLKTASHFTDARLSTPVSKLCQKPQESVEPKGYIQHQGCVVPKARV